MQLDSTIPSPLAEVAASQSAKAAYDESNASQDAQHA